MSETSTQSEALQILLPGSCTRLTSVAGPTLSPPLESELHRFLSLVISDGRYLGEVASNPRLVAESLGFDLSAGAEAEFRAQPLEQHVAELYAKNFQGPSAWMGIAISASIVVIGIVIVRHEAPSRTQQRVRDFSPRARLKL